MDQQDKNSDQTARAEAQRILDRVETDNASFITGAIGRANAHFSGRDAQDEGAAGLWAARIGRALALLAFIALVVNLFTGWFF